MGRVVGLALLLLVFAGAGFLLTCQKNPGELTQQYSPQGSGNNRGAQRQERTRPETRTADRAEVPAQTESRPDEPDTDTATSADTEAQGDEQASEQRTTPDGTDATPPEPPGRRQPPQPAVVHGGMGEVSRGSAQNSRIALTFDAGADSRPTSKILDVLAKHDVRATFFLTGKWLEKNRGLSRQIVQQGHELGNHTYSHRRLTELGSGEIAEEVERTERLALDITGMSTKPYLRVPYGDRNKRVLSVLSDLGYRSIYWDLDCWDSVVKNITPAQVENRVLSKVRNGSIVLMHCGSQATADSLDSLITRLKSAGYRPVTVSELLASAG